MNRLFSLSFLLVIGLVFNALTLQSQSIQEISKRFIKLDPNDSLFTSDQQNMIQDFWSVMNVLKAGEDRQQVFKGSANFGFSGDQSEDQKLYQIAGGIRVNMENYPSQFNFKTGISMILNNGRFSENVSDIHISYDYHPLKEHKLWLENYVFLNRFSDAYLGVDQRYEIGGGVILNKYFKNKLLPTGQSKVEAVSKVTFDPDAYTGTTWFMCTKEKCTALDLPIPDKADIKKLKKAQQREINSVVKNHSQVRLGMLVGGFFELEKIVASDSLETISGKKFYSEEFEAEANFRIELRPTLTYQPTETWSLKMRPYLKFPLPHEWFSTVTQGEFEDKRVDFRMDWDTRLHVSMSKHAGIDLNYRIIYDHAPTRTFYNDLSPEGVPVLLSANSFHHVFGVSFNVGF